MQHIDGHMSIKQVLTQYPFLMDVFKQHGLGKFENPEVLEHLGPMLKLKTALASLSINQELFLQALEDQVRERGSELGFTLADNPERQRELSLLGLLPCGMKMSFSRGMDAFAEDFNRSQGASFRYLVEGNMNHELSYNAYLGSVSSIEELPDIIISSDINAFYHPKFRRDFLDKGCFTDVLGGRLHSDFAAVGYADPEGQFTMLSGNILVLVAIHALAEPFPRPEAWQDLFDPAFANAVVMRGQKEFFCNGVLLPLYARYGMEGLLQFARSVHSGCHPSEMVKMIDSGRRDVPPFYVMPYFFAKKIKRQEAVTVIVPREGAIISPVQMLVKKSAAESMQGVTDFLCGKTFGQTCADAHFPSTHPEVDNHLESLSPLLWLGWDFLRSRDIGQLKNEMKESFREAFLRSGGLA